MSLHILFFFFFFFNDTATTEIYTLSLHDALPISGGMFAEWKKRSHGFSDLAIVGPDATEYGLSGTGGQLPEKVRSEEHTSELQSRLHLVCRLLLEKKKKKNK